MQRLLQLTCWQKLWIDGFLAMIDFRFFTFTLDAETEEADETEEQFESAAVVVEEVRLGVELS